MRRLAFGLVWVIVGAAQAEAAPADDLGKAFKAYREGRYGSAHDLAKPLSGLKNQDYAVYLTAQSALLAGDAAEALPLFQGLAKDTTSRFHDVAKWRLADALWALDKKDEARAAYEKLVPATATPHAQTGDLTDGNFDRGDAAVGLDRIGQGYAAAKKGKAALAAWRRVAVEYPEHPLAAAAEQHLIDAKAPLRAKERIARAERLTDARAWDDALVELDKVSDKEPEAVRVSRDYWIGTTLFKMRKDYARSALLLLAVAPKMEGRAAEAMFHGARALSRADKDDEAIAGYGKVIEKYPHSDFAAEAQFLSGWLEFNRGHYKESLAPLQRLLDKYGSSKFADDARWYLGFARYLLQDYDGALKDLRHVGGPKGKYWVARTLAALKKPDDAQAELKGLVGQYPFSWYSLLARARLKEDKIEIEPFGETAPSEPSVTPLESVDEDLAGDGAIARADELIAAGLGVEAGFELRRGERALIRKVGAGRALPILMDRYRKAGNFNRPWELADAYGARALAAPPTGAVRAWWEAAYPRAYRDTIEKYQALGSNPPYYLFSIMRKESGYDPHVVSYADAIGLLQMIPPTTRRVARHLDLPYTDDLLYDSELNVKVGAWYIGRLQLKFRSQIPIGAGSFNCGPKPVMRWLEQNGKHPVDEFVELVAYTQTREYMKLVTEYYARYLYLYEKKEYAQPLTLDADYLKNDLDY